MLRKFLFLELPKTWLEVFKQETKEQSALHKAQHPPCLIELLFFFFLLMDWHLFTHQFIIHDFIHSFTHIIYLIPSI
jgi:hypothetical protein